MEDGSELEPNWDDGCGVTALQVVPSTPRAMLAKAKAWADADAGAGGAEAGTVQLLVGRKNGVVELLSLTMCGTKGRRVRDVASLWASQRHSDTVVSVWMQPFDGWMLTAGRDGRIKMW